MPRNILVPDDLELKAREALASSIASYRMAISVVREFLDLLDASHAAQRERSDKHDADNRALGALIDPCFCGSPSDDTHVHHYNGKPCRSLLRVDL